MIHTALLLAFSLAWLWPLLASILGTQLGVSAEQRYFQKVAWRFPSFYRGLKLFNTLSIGQSMRTCLSVRELEWFILLGSGQSEYWIKFTLNFKNNNQASLSEVRKASLTAIKHCFQFFPKLGQIENT